MKQKYHLALDTEERRFIIDSLNDLLHRPIVAGRYTDVVDGLLIKLVNVKVKKLKIVYTE